MKPSEVSSIWTSIDGKFALQENSYNAVPVK